MVKDHNNKGGFFHHFEKSEDKLGKASEKKEKKMTIFTKWTAMETRVNGVLNKNQKLYSLYFRVEKMFNCYNDFFTLKELLIHYLIDSELDNLALKKEIKHFLKEKLQSLKLRQLEEEKENERIRVLLEVYKDEEFPF